jgi:predicted ATPase
MYFMYSPSYCEPHYFLIINQSYSSFQQCLSIEINFVSQSFDLSFLLFNTWYFISTLGLLHSSLKRFKVVNNPVDTTSLTTGFVCGDYCNSYLYCLLCKQTIEAKASCLDPYAYNTIISKISIFIINYLQ